MCHAMYKYVLAILVPLCLKPYLILASDCDITITSTPDGPKFGTFQSPDFPNNYPDNSRCIYKLIALPNERVAINFTTFDIKGIPPSCTHDYLDIYTQVRFPDSDLLDLPLMGRYCGTNINKLPRQLISMYRTFILGFYTDGNKNLQGFQGNYYFMDASVYDIGTPAPSNACGFTVKSENKQKGLVVSPTYPGMYPDNIFCYYKLLGQAGQRIKLTFLDFDLYHGGEHCPFDYVKVYDGYTNQAPVIGAWCGKQKDIILFSTSEALTIEFVTRSGRVEPTHPPYRPYWEMERDFEVERRGFKAQFEFRSDFVSLGFIRQGMHILGTECDQRIMSERESNGTITSPNYPGNYPLNVTCKYYIDGLMDKHNLEKTRINFEFFQIPATDNRCVGNGYVAIYAHGQEMSKEGPDKKFCGDATPPLITSTHPRLLLVFTTKNAIYPGVGFRATYEFLTDYAIPGTPATDSKCHFLYNSRSQKAGFFNSPRNPSNYPPNTLCTYEFMALRSEQVRLTFESFNLDATNQNANCTTGDHISVYNIAPYRNHGNNETLMGRYCNMSPGPILSEHDSHHLKLTLFSDEVGVATGFRGRYEFIERKALYAQCGGNFTGGVGGMILSPNFPRKYLLNTSCDWWIYARSPMNRIMIQFMVFELEGTQTGCTGAVVRIYAKGSYPTHELCGPQKVPPVIISENHYMRIRFISGKSVHSKKGFQISWTEIMSSGNGKPSFSRSQGSYQNQDNFCPGFRCQTTEHCISSSLLCNRRPNCGLGDTSDETSTCPTKGSTPVWKIILGIVVALVMLIIIIVCIVHRRRRASKKKRKKKEAEVRYVNRTPHSPVHDHTDVLLMGSGSHERTEKVSIV